MDVYEAVKERRSIRRYKSTPVEEDKIKCLLDAAHLSPSAGNRQPWRFILVKNPETKKRMADATWLRNRMSYVEQAPLVVVGCGVPDESLKFGSATRSDFFYEIDVTIALQTLVLTATSMGLGTCWVGGFQEETVKEILGIPREVRVVALVPIGYPDEAPVPRVRKNLGDIVYNEQYGKSSLGFEKSENTD